MTKENGQKILDFLRESNAIEGVWDGLSLIDAIEAWDFLIAEPTIYPQTILTAHRLLMTNQPIAARHKGALRDCGVMVGGRVCPSHGEVEGLLDKWLARANEYPFNEETIKQLHVEFEKIHPFVDGNGRIGRILLNWHRVKSGYDILVIKEAEKQDYYRWFIDFEKIKEKLLTEYADAWEELADL